MKIEKSIRVMVPEATEAAALHSSFGRVLWAPAGQGFSGGLVDVLRSAVCLMVFVPACIVAGVAVAAAIYIRLVYALVK